ncbi:Cell division cycle-associated 7-like protein [Linum grandiflorum]
MIMCRQKTMNLMAHCKNVKATNKPCPITYCQKCLRNRYGEEVEQVLQVADWYCPKCRGICNCSFCMKKKGHQPTGVLTHKAKESGFASVSELLQVEGPEKFVYARAKKDKDVASPQKTTHILESKVALLGNPAKDNSLEESSDCRACPTSSDDSSEDDSLETNTRPIVLPEIPLPQGSGLTRVAGAELSPEDVGHALQFLEFCKAFGEAFDLKKGHDEQVIRDLAMGRQGCRSQSSVVIQIHIQLLSLIQDDGGKRCPTLSRTDGQDSWLQALGDLVSRSPSMSKDFRPQCFTKENAGYEQLSVTERFKLLNFVCDEALNTKKLKNIMKEQNKSRKEASARLVVGAKNKDKEVKRKRQDEFVKNGSLNNIVEHNAEIMEAQQMVSKGSQRSDAIRTAPMLVDAKGQAFWRLERYNNQEAILLQDLGECDPDSPSEKWFVYNEVQTSEVEKYISETRSRTMVKRDRKSYRPLPNENKEESSQLPLNLDITSSSTFIQE